MTLFLSRLDLNMRHPEVQRDLKDCYLLHRRIYDLFTDWEARPDQPRVLYRLELERHRVLLQWGTRPDWSALPQGYLMPSSDDDLGFDDSQVPTKRIDQILASLNVGTELAFQLRARPEKTADRRRRRPIGDQAGAVAWLVFQSDHHGFEIPIVNGLPDVRLTLERARPGAKVGEFNQALYRGRLRIRDLQALTRAVERGIGRHRAFGMGLLSLARLPS